MAKIITEVSARHCHLSQKHLGKLFGYDYQLNVLKPISQPGQYAAKETVVFKTKGGTIDRLRILGPVRGATQVELSQTDAYHLKIKPPIRLSGDLKGSLGGVLIGPKGSVKIAEGVIIAQRHIHADPSMAKKLGLKNGQEVSVKISGEREVIFNRVAVRAGEGHLWRFQIDTDEGNAGLPGGVCGQGEVIIKYR